MKITQTYICIYIDKTITIWKYYKQIQIHTIYIYTHICVWTKDWKFSNVICLLTNKITYIFSVQYESIFHIPILLGLRIKVLTYCIFLIYM